MRLEEAYSGYVNETGRGLLGGYVNETGRGLLGKLGVAADFPEVASRRAVIELHHTICRAKQHLM